MTDSLIDIVVTWPKTQPLAAYLETLEWALRNGHQINYRVPRLPQWSNVSALGCNWPIVKLDDGQRQPRCYRVHDGAVRGYTTVLSAEHREDGVVRQSDGSFWPAGLYIVCSPVWYELNTPIPMRGFQSWRWMRREIDL